jgi:hypothetical protein
MFHVPFRTAPLAAPSVGQYLLAPSTTRTVFRCYVQVLCKSPRPTVVAAHVHVSLWTMQKRTIARIEPGLMCRLQITRFCLFKTNVSIGGYRCHYMLSNQPALKSYSNQTEPQKNCVIFAQATSFTCGFVESHVDDLYIPPFSTPIHSSIVLRSILIQTLV